MTLTAPGRLGALWKPQNGERRENVAPECAVRARGGPLDQPVSSGSAVLLDAESVRFSCGTRLLVQTEGVRREWDSDNERGGITVNGRRIRASF